MAAPIMDFIQGAIQIASNSYRIGLLGDKFRGHIFFNPMTADPTENTAKKAEGRLWYKAAANKFGFIGKIGSTPTALVIPAYLEYSGTLDPASIATTAIQTNSVTVPGAALGDFCQVSHPGATASGIGLSCHVSAPDTVKVEILNNTGGALDISSGTLRVRVGKA